MTRKHEQAAWAHVAHLADEAASLPYLVEGDETPPEEVEARRKALRLVAEQCRTLAALGFDLERAL